MSDVPTTATLEDAEIDLIVPRRRSAMPLVGEQMAPWLAAAFVLAIVNLVLVADGQVRVLDQALVLVGLGAALTAAGLVSARSSRSLAVSAREERARPAAEELVQPTAEIGSAPYVDGMVNWSAAMLDLIEHAFEVADAGSTVQADLEAAAADTRELHELLSAGTPEELSLNDRAMIHAVCTLWEANQPYVEAMAAAVDPGWHRCWRARSVADRSLRHGVTASQPVVLPYRT